LASELKGGLADAESQQLATKATANPKAQLEYEAGRREWNKRSKEGFENAIQHFERAIQMDPNYADPYVGLGDTYGLLPVYNFADAGEAMPKAKSYAEKAIELNPELASAYNSIAWVLHAYEYDWAGAEANYRKAIQLNPNYATGHHWFGEFLYNMGNLVEGYTHLRKAIELAPTSKIILSQFAFCCWMLNKNEEALENVEKALEIDPLFHFSLAIKYYRLRQGSIDEAISVAEEARKSFPEQPEYLRLLFHLNWVAGDREKALNHFIELLDRYHDSYQKTEIAGIYFRLNQSNNAFRWLQKAVDDRETLVPLAAVEPAYKEFRSDTRFRELFKKINHPLYVD
jgi:tetratricopeptide (TPR) repeat protein